MEGLIHRNHTQSENEEIEERINVLRVINSFKNYSNHSKSKILNKIKTLEKLPVRHQNMLVKYREYLQFHLKCVDINDEIMKRIAENVDIFENESIAIANPEDLEENTIDLTPSANFQDKTHSILKQIVREWSAEGEQERNDCFIPILREIENHFGSTKASEVKILVPGAGLGRLPFEIARRGFTCQGNEFSLFMLFTSNFILNKCTNAHMFTIYPWVHTVVNNFTVFNQVKGVRFPDISPHSIPSDANFSMVCGNFTEVYQQANAWNCVSTCFFIDTAHNVLSYVEKIWQILQPGGLWINMGPLLYHFADQNDSIEPSYDILKQAIQDFGFVYLKETLGVPMHYTQNKDSMMAYKYNSVFFVCQKPVEQPLISTECCG